MASAFMDSMVGLEDVELWLMPSDLVLDAGSVRVEAHVTDLKLVQGPLGQDLLSVKTALSSPLCTQVHGSSTAIRDRWEDWVLRLQVRGTCVFEGPIVGYKIVWGGSKTPGAAIEDPGSTVELVAEGWITHLLRRRYVATVDGAQYTKDDYPNAIACDLIRTAGVVGAVVTPTDWSTAGEVRSNFGPWTLACSAPAGAGSTMKFYQAVGTNLLDTILELCNTPAAEADKLWPAWSRTGTTITLSFLRGRSGAGRQIGTDRTSNPVSAERGNLVGYEEEGDRAQKSNHIGLGGQGRGKSQTRRYAASTSDIATRGVYEEWTALQNAYTTDELDQEGQRLLGERTAGFRKRSYTIAEVAGFQWPTDFGIADTMAFCIPVGQESNSGTQDPQVDEQNVIGVEFTVSGKGPARVKLTLGQWPVTPERDLGRHGGGGRGGRGGGGRPKDKGGSDQNAEDGGRSYAYVSTDLGDVDAEEMNNFLSITGFDKADYVRARTSGTDSGSSKNGGSPDEVEIEVVCDVTVGSVDPTHVAKIKDASGDVWRFGVQKQAP